jgi:hypothetical protein
MKKSKIIKNTNVPVIIPPILYLSSKFFFAICSNYTIQNRLYISRSLRSSPVLFL